MSSPSSPPAVEALSCDIVISEEATLAQLVVRNIETEVKERLQHRARRNGRSMEEEVRDILRDAANQENTPAGGLGTEIAFLFRKVGLDRAIPEFRGHEIKPASFD
jgi:antitoxin FitA